MLKVKAGAAPFSSGAGGRDKFDSESPKLGLPPRLDALRLKVGRERLLAGESANVAGIPGEANRPGIRGTDLPRMLGE